MPEMTAHDLKLVTLGGTIRLTARRSDGCTVEISLTEGAERGSTTRAVTDADGRLVSASVRSWPLAGPEPEAVAVTRAALDIARKGLTEASAR
jgi:hypothetical protein